MLIMNLVRVFVKSRWCGASVLCGLLAVLFAVASPVAANPTVESISFEPSADGYAVRIHASEPLAAYSEPRLLGQQLEILIFNAALAPDFHRDVPAGPIQGYTVVPEGEHLIFQFQLNTSAGIKARAHRDYRTDDLVLGLSYRDGAPVRTVSSNAPVITTQVHGDLSDARQRWKLDTIVIDAGHGGEDTGAIGHDGLLEKDVNLAVAKRLGAMLEQQLGVHVVYTRDADYFVTLRNRGKIANRVGGKLFVSIHSNASTNRRAYGTETYFLGLGKTEAARQVMERENSVVKMEANPELYDAFDEEALILQTLTQSAYLRNSEQLAGLIEGRFSTELGRTSRGVKQARFYVLWGASMPAVLVELGFVTNPQEAAFLGSDTGQQYLAEAIFGAISAFKARYEKGLDYVQAD